MVRMDFDPTIGITENNENIQVGSVFPNPTSNEARIRLKSITSSILNLIVTDMYGKTLSSQTVNSQAGQNDFFINTENFTCGLYTVTVYDGLSAVTRKFTKQ